MTFHFIVYLLLGLGSARGARAVSTCEPLMITLGAEGTAWRLDGQDVKPLTLGPRHGRGQNNLGMYRSRFDGEPVLLKHVAAGAVHEARSSAAGHVIGGPRILGVAKAGGAHPRPAEFIVMEEIFPDEPSFTFQGLFLSTAEERRAGARRITEGPPETRLTRQLADWLARGWLHDVLPPLTWDLIMTDQELRLIDMRDTVVGRRAKTQDWDRFFIHAQLRVVARELEKVLGADVARQFRRDLLAAMYALTDDEARRARFALIANETYDAGGTFRELGRAAAR